MATEQKSVVANPNIGTIFFEDNTLAYNYKTNEWTYVPALAGKNLFSIASDDGVIGEVIDGGTHILYMDQSGGDPQDTIIETSEVDANEGGRTTITGVRPLINKATGTSVTVYVGERDDQSEAVTDHTLSAVNSRTGKHDGRVDGRYVRTKILVTGGFDTILGADIEFSPSGRV